MKTFLSRLQNLFSANNTENPLTKHLHDLSEGDEGIDDFPIIERPEENEE